MLLGNRFRVGEKVSIGRGADLHPKHYAYFGNNVGIGKNVTVESDLRCGDDVLISSNVSFIGNDHRIDQKGVSVYFSGRIPEKEVLIEGDNLIGFGAIVHSGITIGKGAIVAAGCVVTNDVPPFTIMAGVPGRVIRNRFKE